MSMYCRPAVAQHLRILQAVNRTLQAATITAGIIPCCLLPRLPSLPSHSCLLASCLAVLPARRLTGRKVIRRAALSPAVAARQKHGCRLQLIAVLGTAGIQRVNRRQRSAQFCCSSKRHIKVIMCNRRCSCPVAFAHLDSTISPPT